MSRFNYDSEHFQRFLRMRDCDVKKILDIHPRSAKYFLNASMQLCMKAGESKSRIFFDDNSTLLVDSASLYIFNYEEYIYQKHKYKEKFFSLIGTDATVKFIERRAKFYYGDENVWVDRYLLERTNVIIKFPEITITNSLDDTHILRDVFFKISIRAGRICNLSMARTTFDENEYGRYIFSHLNNDKPGKYSDYLCFGETDFKVQIEKARATNSFISIDKFLVSLGGYLSWESLEGVPYKKFADFKKPVMYGTEARYCRDNEEFYKAINIVCNSNIKLRYKFTTDSEYNSKIEISNIHEIDEVLKNEAIDQFIRFENLSYRSLEKKTIDFDESNPPSSDVIFNDEIVPIIVNKSTDDTAFEYGCNVGLLNDVVSELERELFNYFMKLEYE